MPIQTFRLDQLEVSQLNVRTNAEDANAVDALAASIRAKGLLYPLVVHPIEGGRHGVLAGGRRLRAMRLLVEQRDLPADHEVECIVRDLPEAEITELSLSENLLRRELQAYEVHAAIARAADQGHSPDEIAEQLGQRPGWVRQQLRLGRLAEPVFAAYVAGTLSVDLARAYASTEDQALQRAAFEHFSRGSSWEHTDRAVRAFLKVGDRELARLLAFVGDEAYRAAGGRFELDLFADGPSERGRVVDEGLLRELVEQGFEEIRADVRKELEWTGLRFQAEPPRFDGRTDFALAISPEELPARALFDGVVATIELDDEGQPQIGYWWASRKAKGDSGKPLPKRSDNAPEPVSSEAIAQPDSSYATRAREQVREEHGLSADGLQVIRSLRRELLRAALLVDASKGGSLGRDYLIWAQLRQECRQSRAPDAGARGLASTWHEVHGEREPRDIVDPHLSDCVAGAYWREHWAHLSAKDWVREEDPARSLRLFVELAEDEKSHAAAILVGLALLRSANAPGWRVAVHDTLAELAGADDALIRRFWEPTARFTGMLPKMKRLELAQPHVDSAAFRSWPGLKDTPLAAAAAHVLAEAKDWVHPLLTFGVNCTGSASTAVEARELDPVE